MRKVRIKADGGMSACARHCDRSCNGIHTLAASQGTGKTDGKERRDEREERDGRDEREKRQRQRQKGLLTRMNTDRLRIKADGGMSACARHCDRSGNGIHTLAASQGTGKMGATQAPVLENMEYLARSRARGGGSHGLCRARGRRKPR